MAERGMWPSRWRSALSIGAGIVLGGTLITPVYAQVGAADTTDEMKHFWAHFIKRRVTLLGNSRWLGIAAKAGDADKLDGLDSTGFYLFGSKVADTDKLDGLDSTGFYLFGSKVADSQLLDGIDSSGFLRTTGKAADSEKLDGLDSTGFYLFGSKVADSQLLDGIDSTGFLRTTGKAADSEKLDGLDSTQFYAAGSVVDDSDRLDGLDSSAFYSAGAKVDDSERLDGLDSTAFQRGCQNGAVKAFAIIDGRHADLTVDGPFVTTPVSRGFNCNGLAIQVRRTPGMVLGSGDYQVGFGAAAQRGCPAHVVQLTPGPGADAGDDNIVNYVRTASVSSGEFGIVDCYVEVQVRNDGGGAEDGVFFVTLYL